ncbi:maleylacetoacetate isomerase [Nioella nitratireducens]|uniref:maleylacetoacetate isomerase n=1 Tax=Nioella nitratireducens TaxID=1287720 RepID=UPI0008FD32A4|nr:maleylacetoacetate isomerase [Nioella nitratireducens]
MKLYTYWRSSCSYRVRIALGLKGLAWDSIPVHLVKGEQRDPGYVAHNPSGFVPTLVLEDGTELVQSMAILDYLEAVYPDPALLPADPLDRARVLAAAHVIAMDTQPVTNVGVVGHLKATYGVDMQGGIDWMVHFMQRNLAAFDRLIAPEGTFSFGDSPTWADICLVPQLYNAHRWGVDLGRFPRLLTIERAALALPAFDAARPETQPDAE